MPPTRVVGQPEVKVDAEKLVNGRPVFTDLSRMPHLLVAGATGMGKSVGLSVMLISLLYKKSPEEVRLLMFDP